MRILFLAQLLPMPLDAGAKIRSYYVLRHLAAAGHDVTLLSFVRPEDNDKDIRSLRQICSSIHTVCIPRSRVRDLRFVICSLMLPVPFLILRDQVPAMYQSLDRILAGRSFDALHSDQLWMAPYVRSRECSCIKVLDQHNAVFRIPLQLMEHQRNPFVRFFLRKEGAKLASFEWQMCTHFSKVVWVTEEDRRAVISPHKEDPGENHVIPIAIDPAERLPVNRRRPYRIMMLGGVHWPPNLDGFSWFAEYIWPKVAQAVPESVLTLIGKTPQQNLLGQSPRAG